MRDRFEISKRHALLKSLSGNHAAGSWVSCHRWQGHTHRRCVHQPEAADRRKQTISNSADRQFQLGRSAVSHGLRSTRQHRSIFRNGFWRQTLSRRCSCPITVSRPRTTLPILPPFVSSAARPARQQFRFFHLQPARLLPNWASIQSITI